MSNKAQCSVPVHELECLVSLNDTKAESSIHQKSSLYSTSQEQPQDRVCAINKSDFMKNVCNVI